MGYSIDTENQTKEHIQSVLSFSRPAARPSPSGRQTIPYLPDSSPNDPVRRVLIDFSFIFSFSFFLKPRRRKLSCGAAFQKQAIKAQLTANCSQPAIDTRIISASSFNLHESFILCDRLFISSPAPGAGKCRQQCKQREGNPHPNC